MKKGIFKFLSSLVLGVSLLGAPALGSAEACCPYCGCHYSYCCDCCCCDCCCDYYTIEHPGYWEHVEKWVKEFDLAHLEFVWVDRGYDVWHDGYTEVVYY